MNFETKFFQKGYFYSKTEKVHINWIMHIRLRLGSKFQIKLAILIFWTKFAKNWNSKKSHFCMCPWSLLIKLIPKVANRHNNISVSSYSSHRDSKECSKIFCKKFTFGINLPNYIFIGIADHWSVPSIFKTLGKM